jgi:hypothetical protein
MTLHMGPALPDGTAPGVLVPDLTRHADFKLHTAALTPSEGDDPTLLMAVGSSTITDLQGDTMELTALQDMQRAEPGLAIFVNHSYDVPEDVVGVLADTPTIHMKDGIADLMLAIKLLPTVNSRAADILKGIKAGVRQGVSIGCTVDAAAWYDETGQPVADDVDFWDVIEGKVHLHILHVTPLEWSIVGIPANQRSWVQYAAQGMFRRALSDGNAEEARRYAPVVRGYFPKDYLQMVSSVQDAALRKELHGTLPRRSDGSSIVWLPDKGFALTRAGRAQAVTPETVRTLLARHAGHAPAGPSAAMLLPPSEALASAPASVSPDAQKGVSGRTDWPLADRETPWDGAQADRDLRAYAGLDDDGAFDHAKFASGHFWYDSEHADNLTAYKLPFVMKVGGTLKAVPKGIFAVAGALQGSRGGTTIPEADQAKIRKRVEAYYARMRQEFDDATIVAPWADDTKDATPMIVKGSDGEVAVASDGTHAAYTGTHSHRHPAFGSQGGDETHEHAHTHAGDASHDHHADEETKALGDSGPVDVLEDGTHAPFTGTHTHPHQDGAGGDHAHTHAHDGDANHSHPHPEGTVASTDELAEKGVGDGVSVRVSHDVAATPPALDAQRVALLTAYNTLGAQLGFAPVTAAGTPATTPTAHKCALVDNDQDAQTVISLVSQLDDATDRLMTLLHIPDTDEDEDTEGEDGAGGGFGSPPPVPIPGPAYPGYATAPAATASASARHTRRKEGRRHSAADLATLQAIHDAVRDLTDGLVCSGITPAAENPDDSPSVGTVNNGDLEAARTGVAEGKAVVPDLLKTLSALSEALEGTGLKALTEQAAALRAELTAMQAEKAALAEQLDQLANVPLGRPTRLQRRVVLERADDDPVPSETRPALGLSQVTEDFAHVSDPALRTALRQTVKQYVPGVGWCRRWPAGVGKGIRPALSAAQKLVAVRLPDGHIAAYEDGEEALVPITSPAE